MTTEDLVTSAHRAFGAGKMEALSYLDYPDCTSNIHVQHALSGTYHGFTAFLEGSLSKLNDAWPGFMPYIDKVVAKGTSVFVPPTCSVDGGLSGKAIYHFVVIDSL